MHLNLVHWYFFVTCIFHPLVFSRLNTPKGTGSVAPPNTSNIFFDQTNFTLPAYLLREPNGDSYFFGDFGTTFSADSFIWNQSMFVRLAKDPHSLYLVPLNGTYWSTPNCTFNIPFETHFTILESWYIDSLPYQPQLHCYAFFPGNPVNEPNPVYTAGNVSLWIFPPYSVSAASYVYRPDIDAAFLTNDPSIPYEFFTDPYYFNSTLQNTSAHIEFVPWPTGSFLSANLQYLNIQYSYSCNCSGSWPYYRFFID